MVVGVVVCARRDRSGRRPCGVNGRILNVILTRKREKEIKQNPDKSVLLRMNERSFSQGSTFEEDPTSTPVDGQCLLGGGAGPE